jgi:hypothetical protein
MSNSEKEKLEQYASMPRAEMSQREKSVAPKSAPLADQQKLH